MKNKKTIISISLCIVLLLTSLAFVACDDSDTGNVDDDSTNLGESFIGIETEHIEGMTDIFISYGINHSKLNSKTTTVIMGNFYSPEMAKTNLFGLGFAGYISLVNLTNLNNDTSHIDEQMTLLFYDTTTHAETAIEAITASDLERFEYDVDKTLITLEDQIIILEQQKGFYNKVCSHPAIENDNETIKYIKDSLNKELHSNNRHLDFVEPSLLIENGKIVSFGLHAMPKTGNRDKCYGLHNITWYNSYYGEENWQADFNNKKADYTADSYSTYTMINGEKYIAYYYQYKADVIICNESDISCTLCDIYYDGNSVNIPSTYNGKPISAFDYWLLNEADSLTDIYFDGTMEQWKQIFKSDYFNKFIVHCSDGIIEKQIG